MPPFHAAVHALVAPFRVVVVLVRAPFLAPSRVALSLVAAAPATHVPFRVPTHPRVSAALWRLPPRTVCRMLPATGRTASLHDTYVPDRVPSEKDTTNVGDHVQAESDAGRRTIQGDTFQIQQLEWIMMVSQTKLRCFKTLVYLPGDSPGIPGKLVYASSGNVPAGWASLSSGRYGWNPLRASAISVCDIAGALSRGI